MTVESVNTLCQTVISKLNDELHYFVASLPPHVTTNSASLSHVEDCFTQSMNMFGGLQTEYERLNYLRNKGLVMPQSVRIGSRLDTKADGSQRLVPIYAQYVPIKQTLAAYLTAEQFTCFPSHTDNRISRFEDTPTFKTSSYFMANPSALKIIIYHDDLELGDPLGSRAGVHKLTMFYYSVHGFATGKLRQIHLLLACHSSDIKQYGYDTVLKPLLEDLVELDLGFEVDIGGSKRVLRGRVTHLVGDNLACNQILGLVCSFTNTRFCRFCYISGDESQTCTSIHGQLVRSATSHTLDVELSAAFHDSYRNTGVKSDCVLDSIPYFSSMDATVPDIM